MDEADIHGKQSERTRGWFVEKWRSQGVRCGVRLAIFGFVIKYCSTFYLTEIYLFATIK